MYNQNNDPIKVKNVKKVSFELKNCSDGIEKFYEGNFYIESNSSEIHSLLISTRAPFWKSIKESIRKKEQLKNEEELYDYFKNLLKETSDIAQRIIEKAKSRKEFQERTVEVEFLMSLLTSYLEEYFDDQNEFTCQKCDGVYFKVNNSEERFDEFIEVNFAINLCRNMDFQYTKKTLLNDEYKYWLDVLGIHYDGEWKEYNKQKEDDYIKEN